ncbi:MAG: hypothetical protein JOZ54_07535, partial [Acidobacteria bacterium]|nr:hypothetical protein [Acidobacteriota bacterium]
MLPAPMISLLLAAALSAPPAALPRITSVHGDAAGSQVLDETPIEPGATVIRTIAADGKIADRVIKAEA